MRHVSVPADCGMVPCMSKRVLSAWLLVAAFGCDEQADEAERDVSAPDAALTDASLEDVGRPNDARPPDAVPTDALPPDALPPDAQPDDGRFRMPRRPTCDGAYGGAVALGDLDDVLVEVSGLTASPTTDGVVWAHNDSGGEPELYALREDGTRLGRLRLDVEAIDWEDVASAPCPDGLQPCLWVADTGNNLRNREQLVVYATPEPDVTAPFGEIDAGRVWTFPVRYPNETLDAEALVVARDGGTFWIFEKVDGDQARLYRHPGPLANGRPVDLTLVGTVDTPGIPVQRGKMITGADLHPSGTRLLLRVYSGSYEYRFDPGGGPDDVVDLAPSVVSPGPLSERQGEAITYTTSGTHVLTASEDPPNYATAQPLHIYRCAEN